MRLIDADTLIKDLSYLYTKNHIPVDMRAKETLSKIMEQPTAYDMDKVVAQLKLTSKTALDLAIKRIPGFRFMAPGFQALIDECFEEAVEIVKAGGNA